MTSMQGGTGIEIEKLPNRIHVGQIVGGFCLSSGK